MGWLNEDGKKEGTWLEGEESPSHPHKDGTFGTDIDAYRNTYKDGERVSHKKAKDWGKQHTRESSSNQTNQSNQKGTDK
jgi:hypothetical protein